MEMQGSLLLLDEIQIYMVPAMGDQWEILVGVHHRTLGHERLAGLVASIALLEEVLWHAEAPGGRDRELWRGIVLPSPRSLGHAPKLGLEAGI